MSNTGTSIMEGSRPQQEYGKEVPFEHNQSQDFFTDQLSGSRGFQKGDGSAIPHHRLVILGLSLLNAALLIVAVVIGIYCAKADEDSVLIPHSAAPLLIMERNHLRNRSDIIKEKLDAEAKLVKERANHDQLKLQLKQQRIFIDTLQTEIGDLMQEKADLKSNKTRLEESCGKCPLGWHFLKTSCYYISRFESANKKNWPDSRADCLRKGGDLLVIDNLEEQQIISNIYPKISANGYWWENGHWIGLTDIVNEGTWVWVNNVTVVETMYWRNDQPSRSGAQSGNCAAYYYSANSMKTWYNGNCQEHRFNWICEMQPDVKSAEDE